MKPPGIQAVRQLQVLDKKKRDEIIRAIKGREGVNIKQIARDYSYQKV